MRMTGIITLVLLCTLAVSCTSKTQQVLQELRDNSKKWSEEIPDPLFAVEIDSDAFEKKLALVKSEGAKLAERLGPEGIPAMVAELVTWENQANIGEPQELFSYYYPVICEALMQLGKASVPHLAESLKSSSGGYDIAWLLGRLHAREELHSIFEESTGKTRFYAAIGLALDKDVSVLGYFLEEGLKFKDGVPSPSDFFTDREGRERFAALWVVSEMGEAILDPLYNELTGPEGKRRENAWKLLGHVRCEGKVELVKRLLDDTDEGIRKAAVSYIPAGSSEGAKLVVKLLKEWDDYEALLEKAKDGFDRGVPILAAALETADFEKRKVIAELLRKEAIKMGHNFKNPGKVNYRVKALIESLELPRGEEMLKQLRDEPSKLFKELMLTKDPKIEMYGQALAQGGEELFGELLELVANPTEAAKETEMDWSHEWGQVSVAAEALKLIDAEGAIAELRKMTASQDPETVKRALDAMWQIGAGQAHEALLGAAVSHEDAKVRAHAVSLLPDEMLSKTLAALGSEKDAQVRRAIVRKAAQSGQALAAPVLRDVIKSLTPESSEKDVKVALYAAEGLAAQGHREDEDLFLKMLEESKESGIRAAAVHGLGVIANAGSVKVLKKTLEGEKDSHVRREVIHALGRLDTAESVTVLTELLNDTESRYQAAASLAKMGREEALEPLFERLFYESEDEKSWDIEAKQHDAAAALSELPDEVVRRALCKRLGLDDPGEFEPDDDPTASDSDDPDFKKQVEKKIELGRALTLPQKWLATWVGAESFDRDIAKDMSHSGYERYYAAAALARSSSRYNDNLLAVDAAINDLWFSEGAVGLPGPGRGQAMVVRLFPDAPQVDWQRYRFRAKCPQFKAFMEWYKENRFNLEFDDEARVFRLREKEDEPDK